MTESLLSLAQGVPLVIGTVCVRHFSRCWGHVFNKLENVLSLREKDIQLVTRQGEFRGGQVLPLSHVVGRWGCSVALDR